LVTDHISKGHKEGLITKDEPFREHVHRVKRREFIDEKESDFYRECALTLGRKKRLKRKIFNTPRSGGYSGNKTGAKLDPF